MLAFRCLGLRGHGDSRYQLILTEFKRLWVKVKPPGYGPQILVQVSTYQGPFWGYPIFDPRPNLEDQTPSPPIRFAPMFALCQVSSPRASSEVTQSCARRATRDAGGVRCWETTQDQAKMTPRDHQLDGLGSDSIYPSFFAYCGLVVEVRIHLAATI